MLIIRIQDILLGILVAMIFMHRYVPIDISSLWQYLLVGMVYFLARSAPAYVRKYASYVILCWGVCEVIIVLLQKWHWISSNHSWFDITGTFGNPGPLGGFLGILCAGVVNVIYRRRGINDIRTLAWVLIGAGVGTWVFLDITRVLRVALGLMIWVAVLAIGLITVEVFNYLRDRTD